MISNVFIKAFMAFSGIGGTFMAGGAIAYNKITSHNETVDNTEYEEREEFTTFTQTPIIPLLPKFNFAILLESDNPIQNIDKSFKCQIEDGSVFEVCALSKIVEVGGKKNKWISITEFKKLSTDANIADGFNFQNRTIYKVTTKWSLTNEWNKDTSKKLNVYSKESADSTTTPLITLAPKSIINRTEKYWGPLEYAFVKAIAFKDVSVSKTEKHLIKGKKFKCNFPNDSGKFEDCEIFDFFEVETISPASTNKAMKPYFTKTSEITKNLHYLIKFSKPLIANNESVYGKGQTIKVDIYTEDQKDTNGLTSIDFKYVLPTIVINYGDEIDMALVF